MCVLARLDSPLCIATPPISPARRDASRPARERHFAARARHGARANDRRLDARARRRREQTSRAVRPVQRLADMRLACVVAPRGVERDGKSRSPGGRRNVSVRREPDGGGVRADARSTREGRRRARRESAGEGGGGGEESGRGTRADDGADGDGDAGERRRRRRRWGDRRRDLRRG